ncbi:MAG: hypothetical protein HQ503_16285 [Rhodospirillales bacterium]|nr:hypothetical protein [Rhodospirillales bacterium]
MKRGLVLAFTAVLVAFFYVPFGNAADGRIVLLVPEEARTQFLREMRGHLASLEEILSAIAEEDFKGAAEVAENHLKFGPSIWAEMASHGMTPGNIAKMRKQYRGMSSVERQKLNSKMGVEGRANLPASFENSVQLFYSATGNFAEVAKTVGDPPTPEDYESVILALKEITSICRRCHDDYQLK